MVRYTRVLPDFPFFLEGYIYWDANEQKVRLWNINSRGGSDRGVVTLEDGTLTDRWFQSLYDARIPGFSLDHLHE